MALVSSTKDIKALPEPFVSLSDERFRRTGHLQSASPAGILEIIDFAFQSFLQDSLAEALKEGVSRGQSAEEIRNWLGLIAETPLSSVLKTYCGEKFSSRDMLSNEGLARLVYECNYLGDTICEVEKTALKVGRGKIEESPLGHAWQLAFGDPKGQLITSATQHLIPCFFSHYLLQNYFFRPDPSPQEIAERSGFEVALKFDAYLDSLLSILPGLTASHEGRKVLLHTLLRLRAAEIPADTMLCFMEDLDNVAAAQADRPQLLKKNIEALLSKHFAELVYQNGQPETVRMVVLGPQGGKLASVVPLDNFYFRPEQPAAPSVADLLLFPQSGNLVRSSDREQLVAGKRDISVFDTRGLKVFWGDLPSECIKSMQGPLYVLSSTDSYHEVPEWAVKKQSTAQDPKRSVKSVLNTGIPFAPDSLFLDLDYIRLKALGKIVQGKFVCNPLKVNEV